MLVSFGNVTKNKYHTSKEVLENIPKNISFLYPYTLDKPKIIVNYDTTILNKNYVTLVLNNKTYYYYIVQKTIDKHDLILQLEMDYLHTYKNEILQCNALISRCSNGNKFIKDNLAVQLQKPIYEYKNLGSVFNSGITYIMIKGK